MEKILQALKEEKINEYLIVEETVYGKEWFCIGKKLDMSRAKKVKHFYLTVYQTIYECNERYKGSASCKLSEAWDMKRIQERICDLVKEAGYVKNPYYELPSPSSDIEGKTSSSLGTIQGVFDVMADFHEDEDIALNSYELFESMTEVRIVNSKGVDVTYSYPSHELEVIINAKNEDHEIEIYQDIHFGEPNIAELKHQLGKATRQAKDRVKAEPLKQQHICQRVIISQENVLSIFRYYLFQLRVDALYQQYSTVAIGDKLGPADFHLEGLPYLEHSSMNFAYDREGRPCRQVTLVDKGQVQNFWGDHIFSSYTDNLDTTMVYNFKIAPGSITLEKMKSEPYLEIVQFSDFLCHPITGDFNGEIRLGYYFDGEKKVVISKGSISGNIKDNEKTMVLSKELSKYNNAVVPSAILLEKVRIACE